MKASCSFAHRRLIFGLVLTFLASAAFAEQASAIYDPSTGRWLSRDPLNNAEMRQGPNLYQYVGNSPTNRTDPTGLWYTWVPGSWFDGRGHEGGGSEFYRYRDWEDGAYAGLDGLNPFGRPFANNGFYDPCDEANSRSYNLGSFAQAALFTAAGAKGAQMFGSALMASGAGTVGIAEGATFTEQMWAGRLAIPYFVINSGEAFGGGTVANAVAAGTGGTMLLGGSAYAAYHISGVLNQAVYGVSGFQPLGEHGVKRPGRP